MASVLETALAGLRVPAPAGFEPHMVLDGGVGDGLVHAQGPIGPVVVAFNKVGIVGLALQTDLDSFLERHHALTGRGLFETDAPTKLRQQIDRALDTGDGSRLHYDLRALSPFFRAALTATATIPPGQFRSYSWVAAEAGNDRAVRAAGSAMAANPIPLLIPCHRVVRRDGLIGNYGMGGPEVKRRLLTLEGAPLDD